MIQVDDRMRTPTRQPGVVAEPADPGRGLLSTREAEDPEDEDRTFFVSPPPAPFPRVLPGL